MFLSVGALFTVGRFGGGGTVGTMDVAEGGRAWSATPTPVVTLVPEDGWRLGKMRHPAFLASPPSSPIDLSLSVPRSKRSSFPLDVSTPPSTESDDDDGDDDDDDDRPPRPEYDWERVIGRTSAWVCTTAYLTSRLPQIWQNVRRSRCSSLASSLPARSTDPTQSLSRAQFRRRSVEGLAMTLFAAAFLGNSLYVASILTNPLATSTRYLLESTPYLLGSGGTLCFDLMIIAQSWLYSDKRKARRDRERRRRGAHGFDAEEEAALLYGDGAGDGRLGDGYGDGEAHKVRRTGSRIKPQRSRSTSTLGARSISAGRTLSTSRGPRRSESTELVPGAGGSRGARFLVSPHDAEHALALDNGDDDGASLDGPSRSVSRGSSTRVLSRQPSFDAIQEEGESSVTLRGADD